jgi:rubrerythrin
MTRQAALNRIRLLQLINNPSPLMRCNTCGILSADSMCPECKESEALLSAIDDALRAFETMGV